MCFDELLDTHLNEPPFMGGGGGATDFLKCIAVYWKIRGDMIITLLTVQGFITFEMLMTFWC